MTTTLAQLNSCNPTNFVALLHGIYEHSPWVAQRAAARRPFATLAALKLALQDAVGSATEAEQLGLICAHPELAGKAAQALSAESRSEQARAGLNHCSPTELAALQQLNADYRAKFGFPCIVAVKGPDGRGLSRQQIIAAFTRRLRNRRADELAECLRQIGRIAELRLNDLLGHALEFGHTVLAWAETLAAPSDMRDGLTCAFMTQAHRDSAAQLAAWMHGAGLQTEIDAVGNVVGRYRCDDQNAKTLLTGSHYDTVRNGGKYDGRAGILVPLAVLRQLHERGEKLPFHVEVIGFADEEGVRFDSTFLGSSAVIGAFDPALLEQTDADGVTMRAALLAAGHNPTPARIAAIARDPAGLLGFVEIHIEQGPVLLGRDLPVGIVTSIAGSLRYQVELTGMAGHAGTTPMTLRRDAAAAAAEIVLLVERRCAAVPTLVGTVGQLQVPHGSVNVIPGSCRLSLDIRAADDATRDAAAADVLREIDAICARRNIDVALERIEVSAAAPCAPWLMRALAQATERAGIPAFTLPSGAGHDAMILAQITDVAMLFIRCGNGGISHNPLETMTADDAEIAAQIFLDFLRAFNAKDA